MNEAFVKSAKHLLLLVLLYIATLVVGVVLGSVFNNIEMMKWTLVIGLMLLAGWLYWRTGSIIPGIVILIRERLAKIKKILNTEENLHDFLIKM